MNAKHVLFICAAVVLIISSVYAFDLPKWFPFNKKDALNEWQEKIFHNKVLYEVQPQAQSGHLTAVSDRACSGLIYRVKFDPKEFPMITWNWQVSQFPDKTRAATKTGSWIEQDDYAARVYVIFSSWNFFNIKSLEYVWDETLPEGKIIESPNYANLKLLVIESGHKNLGQWVKEERDIVRDYELAFGRKPDRHVAAIAIMTDSDNTVSTAEAYYKDIKVGYRK